MGYCTQLHHQEQLEQNARAEITSRLRLTLSCSEMQGFTKGRDTDSFLSVASVAGSRRTLQRLQNILTPRNASTLNSNSAFICTQNHHQESGIQEQKNRVDWFLHF